MAQLTTQNITVGAESSYQADYSRPLESRFVHTYRIRITNHGTVPVRLLNRVWNIIDGMGQRRTVEGEGVVGQQPEILPGQTHEYTSWVQFETPVGAMEGSFGMVRRGAQGQPEYFSVEIPRFLHIAPSVLN